MGLLSVSLEVVWHSCTSRYALFFQVNSNVMVKKNITVIQHIITDIKWKYLLLSTLLSFCILLLLGSLLASYKAHSFAQAFDSGKIVFSNYNGIQDAGDRYFNSYYWVPLHLLSIMIAQFFSCLFLVKHAKGVELTNGLAHGFFSAVFICQFNFISSLIGIIISLFVAIINKTESAVITDIKP